MKRGTIGFLVASLLALGVLVSPPVMAAETWRIGALFPFTGSLALLGNESFNGAVIAQDMVNEKGRDPGKEG